ncbi:MAG: DUF4197 domain-containing protein [Nibricoccus sp.]
MKLKTYLSLLVLPICALSMVAADAQPTAEEASKGLKAAMGSLVDQSLATVSDPKALEGFAINLPDKLKKLESTLRTSGQGQLVDDFKAKLKNAAVQVLPLSKDAFKSETNAVTADDPMAVLKAAPDGVTNFTKQKTRPPILTKVQPLINAKFKENGVGAAYQAMVAKAGPMAAAMFGKEPPANLEQNVTEQTVDFVYGQMAKGEGALRANPAMSKDGLVKKVFSMVKK